jgi:hypothetical protein
MPSTYEPIATVTASGSSSTLNFTSIPSTYTDLRLVANLRSADSRSGYQSASFTYNGSTTSLYSGTIVYGNGTSASSYRQSASVIEGLVSMNGLASGLFLPNILDIMNYSNTTTFKTTLVSMGGAGLGAYRQINTYRSTAAISSIKIEEASALNWVAGSTATLYGIKAA